MNYCITVFQGLIFLLQCMPKFEAFTLSQALPINNTRKVVNRTVDRTHGSGESTVGAIRRNENERGRLGPTWGPSYRPHYGYEPYWAAGNWVNKEAVKPPTKEEFVKFIEYNGTGPTPEGYRGTEHCPIPCPKLYSDYGVICARDVNQTLKTFKNYCHMLYDECAGFNTGKDWIMVYKRECWNYTNRLKVYMHEDEYLYGRLDRIIQRYKNKGYTTITPKTTNNYGR